MKRLLAKAIIRNCNRVLGALSISFAVALCASAYGQPVPQNMALPGRGKAHDYYVVTLCSLTGQGCHNQFYLIPAGVSEVSEGVNAALIRSEVGKMVTDDGNVW